MAMIQMQAITSSRSAARKPNSLRYFLPLLPLLPMLMRTPLRMSNRERSMSSAAMVLLLQQRMLYLYTNWKYWKMIAKYDMIWSQQSMTWKQTDSSDCGCVFFSLVGKRAIQNVIINLNSNTGLYTHHFSLRSLSKVWHFLSCCSESIFIMIQNRDHMGSQQQTTSLLEIIKRKDFIRQTQTLIDKTVTYKRQRWGYLALFYLYVLYRFYIYEYLGLMYIIGLYVIYLIVQYFTPSGLPDPDEDTPQSALFLEQSVAILTSTEGDRPVLRSLTEFNLWKSLSLLGVGSWLCTWFDLFLIPVYWPFLLIYFTWLIGLAVVKHCIHMRKYGYKISDFNSKKPVEF